MTSLREQWLKRTGIDWPCYIQILKGATAPAIALACGQTTTWVQLFGNLGYLVPFAAIICHPMRPRAQFLHALLLNVVTVCMAAAVTILAMFCMVKARHGRSSYDSSASAVAGVWLATMTFVITAARARYANMLWPCAAALLFSNYGTVYATEFVDMHEATAFLRRLLLANLIGFAISAGVCLLLFPTNSHRPFLEVVAQCANTAQSCLKATCSLRKTLASKDAQNLPDEISRLRQKMSELAALQTQLASSATPAIQEISVGGLKSDELEEMFHKMKDVLTPFIGLNRLGEVAESIIFSPEGGEKFSRTSGDHLSELLECLELPFDQACAASCHGLELVLRNIPSYCSRTLSSCSGMQSNCSRIHSNCSCCNTGHNKYNEKVACYDDCVGHLEGCLERFLNSKKTLSMLCRDGQNIETIVDDNEARDAVFVVLRCEFLIWTTTKRVLELLQFTQRTTVLPGLENASHQARFGSTHRILRYAAHQCQLLLGTISGLATMLRLLLCKSANVTQRSKSPRSFLSRTSRNNVHLSLKFFSTTAAAGFALRVAAAVMSIAIVAFLKDTQAFYIKQHLVWAQYAVSFAMQASKGQSIRHFLMRLGGTVLAVCLALVAWYIVDGHPAGVLVFYFLFMQVPAFIVVKHPRILTTGSVSAFALTVVLGNGLQLRHFGPVKAKHMGLAIQPMWLIGLIRLAAIAGGLLLATIWTLVPFPISEQDQIKCTTSVCLNSVARHYTSTQMTARSRLKGGSGDELKSNVDDIRRYQGPHHRRVADIDRKLASMSSQLNFAKWDIQFGDHFPRSRYERIHQSLATMMRSLDIIRLAVIVFTDSVATAKNLASSPWLRKFRHTFEHAEESRHQITMVLMVLANSMNTSTPLPPFLRVPDPYLISRALEKIDKDVLSVRNAGEPGLATFATIQIELHSIHRDVEDLMTAVKELVGELDVCDNV